jgi:diaminohydroxyphosphoribosylaminopyrimidine deaminase / 5-amino-6-(5-phosphoribosylamino)uracil reductase
VELLPLPSQTMNQSPMLALEVSGIEKRRINGPGKSTLPEERTRMRHAHPANAVESMPDRRTDEDYLREALELARRGMGLTSPNPNVGAVIVADNGEVIGMGTHTYDGLKHAEILALEQAGERARGATVFVNLEPCSHQGRTGPCAEALIAAGVRRVVAGIVDPNPLVSGQGFARLRQAGISVASGLLAEECQRVNEAFANYIRRKMPLVTLKTAMTLDGKIAPPPGESENPTALGSASASGGWITSEVARAHVQELRHQSDAILVGVGTIIADDPLLTDRSGRPRRRPLLRVIVDSRLRLPLESRLVQSGREDILVVCSFAEEKRKQMLREHGIRVEQLPAATPDGRPNLASLMQLLGGLELTSLLIEGGAMINWAALHSGIVDKIFFYYAPKVLAGSGAVPFATASGFKSMSDAAYVKGLRFHRFGEDFAVEGYLRDPYRD